ncbi:MAG: MGMT family protein [Candidatus Thalassarchaeaceae archaeon]|nr:MGMT family protein [Candidatus Thalassarchaeaceae archaeon]
MKKSNRDLTNSLVGTEFQKLVWRELLKIPRGEVRTYKEIAISIGRPNSSRAVANACARNPYAPDVPCHRVIRSNGEIGGYSYPGGVSLKISLLVNEGAIFPR